MIDPPIERSAMRVLIAHNAYRERGGEDVVAEAEAALLCNRGHAVEAYTRHNDEVAEIGSIAAARDSVWSLRTRAELRGVIADFRPDVIHVHNTFPLISPSIYWEAARARVPVVQTLHNFRLLCPQAMLLRRGRVCEACVGRFPWRSVAWRCYHDSALQSAAISGMLAVHRFLGTWETKITRFIALNEFSRAKFIAGGLRGERIVVKPNFVEAPVICDGRTRAGFLFVGRLVREKGVHVLAQALAADAALECELIGIGDSASELSLRPRIRLTGWRDSEYIMRRMQSAIALVMPSLAYENFPRTVVEAFACGLPVIASRLGAMAALIRDGDTGLLFEPGDAADLGAKLCWAQAHPEAMRSMGAAARREYAAHYTSDVNYRQLLAIYDEAIAEVKAHGE